MATKKDVKKPAGKEISENQASSMFCDSPFAIEKDMCDYIENNISVFCEEIIGDEYESHIREYQLALMGKLSKGTAPKKGDNNPRIDFLIFCKHGVYAVECKNPKQTFTELSRSIGQLVMYDVIFKEKGINPNIILVSSKYDPIISKCLKSIGKEYRFVLFNKQYSAELE
jgi:hypothetical protein